MLRRGLLATIWIYGGCFQILRFHVQPHFTRIGFDNEQASGLAALLGVTVVLAIPLVVRHSRLSDEDSTRSATEASLVLVLAAPVGLATLLPGPQHHPVLLTLLLAAFFAATEVGGNATASAAWSALTKLDPRAVLLASLARSGGVAIGGALASSLGWTGAACAVVASVIATTRVLRRWEHHPTDEQGWIEDSDPLLIRLRDSQADARGRFTVEFAGRAERLGPWPVERRDTVFAKRRVFARQPRAERVDLCALRFDWPLVRVRNVRRRHGRLFPGARVPLALPPTGNPGPRPGRRRRRRRALRLRRVGTLHWRGLIGGSWQISDDGELTLHSEGLDAPVQFVKHRHGPI